MIWKAKKISARIWSFTRSLIVVVFETPATSGRSMKSYTRKASNSDSKEFYRGRHFRHKEDLARKTEEVGRRVQRGSAASRAQGKDAR